jgi:hypothetical protein
LDYRLCKRCRQNNKAYSPIYNQEFAWDNGEDTLTETDVGWYCPVLQRTIFKDEKAPSKCICILEHIMIEQEL